MPSSAILSAKPAGLGQSRQAICETFHWLSRVRVPRFSNWQCSKRAHRCVNAPTLRKQSTRRKQDLSRNSSSRMTVGPTPDLPLTRPAASPTCLACQPLANNLGHHSEQRYPLAALQPHIAVFLVVHAFLEQASLTLPGNVWTSAL